MNEMWTSIKAATNRRSFLKNGVTVASVAAVGAGLLASTSSILRNRAPKNTAGV